MSPSFSLFIHWGLYSLPAGVWNATNIPGYSEQIMAHARIPRDEYEQLCKQFDPRRWNPAEVAGLAKASGMTSVVLTAKHHDGFCLFDSKFTDFNVVKATPYGRDIVGELAAACAAEGIKFGVYFSTIDWHFEGANGIDYGEDGSVRNDNLITEPHTDFNIHQLHELLSNYGPIEQVWFDMGNPTLEQSRRFADTVHQLQPACLVSGRVFNQCGDFAVVGDNEVPDDFIDGPWQCPASIFDETWGYRSWQVRDRLDAKVEEHISRLKRVMSRGGSYLLNIGPRGDGSIVEFEAQVVKRVGEWLIANKSELQSKPSRPELTSNPQGAFELTFDNAARYYRYNNRGYYDLPTLTRLAWRVVCSTGGMYVIDAWAGDPTWIQIGGLKMDAMSSRGTAFSLAPGPQTVEVQLVPGAKCEKLILKPYPVRRR